MSNYHYQKYNGVGGANVYEGSQIRRGRLNAFGRPCMKPDVLPTSNEERGNQFSSDWQRGDGINSYTGENVAGGAENRKCHQCGNLYRNQGALELHLVTCSAPLSSDEDVEIEDKNVRVTANTYRTDYEESVVVSDDESSGYNRSKGGFSNKAVKDQAPLEGLAGKFQPTAYRSTENCVPVSTTVNQYQATTQSSFLSPTSNRVSTIQYAPPSSSKQTKAITASDCSSSYSSQQSSFQHKVSREPEIAPPYPRISAGSFTSQIHAHQHQTTMQGSSGSYYAQPSYLQNRQTTYSETPAASITWDGYTRIPAYQTIAPSTSITQRIVTAPATAQQHYGSTYQTSLPSNGYYGNGTYVSAPAVVKPIETITMQDAYGTIKRIAVPQVPTVQTTSAPYSVVSNSNFVVSMVQPLVQNTYLSSSSIIQQKPGLATLHPISTGSTGMYPVQQNQTIGAATIFPVQQSQTAGAASIYPVQNSQSVEAATVYPVQQSQSVLKLPTPMYPTMAYKTQSYGGLNGASMLQQSCLTQKSPGSGHIASSLSAQNQATFQPSSVLDYQKRIIATPVIHAIQNVNSHIVVNRDAHQLLNVTPLPQIDLTRSFNDTNGHYLPKTSYVQHNSISSPSSQQSMKLFPGSNSAVLLPVMSGNVFASTSHHQQGYQHHEPYTKPINLVSQQQHCQPISSKAVILPHGHNCMCIPCRETRFERQINVELMRPSESQRISKPLAPNLSQPSSSFESMIGNKRRMVEVLPHPSKYIKVHRTLELQKVPQRMLSKCSDSAFAVDSTDSGFSDTSYSSKDSPPQLIPRGPVLTTMKNNYCGGSPHVPTKNVQRKQALPKPPKKQVWNSTDSVFEKMQPQMSKYKRVSRKPTNVRIPKVPKERKRKERVVEEHVSKTYRLTRKSTTGVTYMVKEVRKSKKNAENENILNFNEPMKCIRIKRGKKTGDSVMPLQDVFVTPVLKVFPIWPETEITISEEITKCHEDVAIKTLTVAPKDSAVKVQAGGIKMEVNVLDTDKESIVPTTTDNTTCTTEDLKPDESDSSATVPIKNRSGNSDQYDEAPVLDMPSSGETEIKKYITTSLVPGSSDLTAAALSGMKTEHTEANEEAIVPNVSFETNINNQKQNDSDILVTNTIVKSEDVLTEVKQIEETLQKPEAEAITKNAANEIQLSSDVLAESDIVNSSEQVIEAKEPPSIEMRNSTDNEGAIIPVKTEEYNIEGPIETAVHNTHRFIFLFEIKVDGEVRYRAADIHSLWDQVVQLAEGRKCNRLLPPLFCPAKEISVPCGKTYSDVVNSPILAHEALQFILQQVPDSRRQRVKRGRKRKAIELIVLDNESSADKDDEGALSGSARLTMYRREREFDMFAWLGLSKECQVKGYDPTKSSDQLRVHNGLRARREKKPSWRLIVRHSPIQGRGVFTKSEIQEGEDVIEYTGEVIRPMLCDKREKLYESKGYGCYMFRIDDDEVVDATLRGNAARFINHSCEPNCKSRIVEINGRKRIFISTIRTIFEGEELSYDYKFAKESKEKKISCSCGAPKCRKFLN